MYIFYYWLRSINGEIKQIMEDKYLGDIGETIMYGGSRYTISDWTSEFHSWKELI